MEPYLFVSQCDYVGMTWLLKKIVGTPLHVIYLATMQKAHIKNLVANIGTCGQEIFARVYG